MTRQLELTPEEVEVLEALELWRDNHLASGDPPEDTRLESIYRSISEKLQQAG